MPASRSTIWTEVIGDRHLIRTMTQWAARSAMAEPAYKAMHEYVLDIEKELFESEGASGAHGRWEPLKTTDEPPHPILQASRALMESLTSADSPHHRFVIAPDGFAMGTDLTYGEFHQTGTSHMPQRRIVDFTSENRLGLVAILDEWIFRAGLVPSGGGVFGFRVRGTRGRFIG